MPGSSPGRRRTAWWIALVATATINGTASEAQPPAPPAQPQPQPAQPQPAQPQPAQPQPAQPQPAQPQPAQPEQPPDDTVEAGAPDVDIPDEADLAGEVIVVTGTRIRHSSLITLLPVITLDAQDILMSGKTEVADVVQRVAGLTNSLNTAATADQQGVEGDADTGSSVGVATLNLRGLGTKRTLVLVDGRRHVGGRAGDTAVDINTIPTALVERIEVLTGGASAIYGADAVSGVVNIITKRDFDSFETRAQVDTNTDGKGVRTFVSGAAGSKFAKDRGSAVIALEYRDQRRMLCGDAGFCRDFGVLDDEGTPNNADGSLPPRTFGEHLTFAVSSPAGRIGIDFDGDGVPDGAAPDGFFVDTDGDGVNDVGQTRLGAEGYGDWVVENGRLRLFQEGQQASFANEFGGDGIASGPFNFQTILPENQTAVANALVRYKVLDRVNFFSDSKFAYSRSVLRGQVNGFNDLLTVSLDNPYIPSELRTALDGAIKANPALADTAKIYITRDFLDLGPNITENERQTFRVVNGFDGKLAGGITYEVAYNYGRTAEEQLLRNSRIEDRFFAAIDVVTGPNGQPVCRSDLDGGAFVPPTSPFPEVPPGFRTFQPGDGTCKPLNLFGLGAPSQEAIDFVSTDLVQNSIVDQHVATVTFIGDSEAVKVKLPAGPIGFAAGGEYRHEFSRFRPDEFSETGLVFDGTKIAGVEGSYDVWEAFAETRVPILPDSSPVGLLGVDGAVRFAEYSTIGSSVSWKAGGNWAPLYDVRLRGGYAVAVRAPNVGELFQPDTAAFFRPIDPCDATAIETAPDPAVRARNCLADGIPADYTDPLTARFAGLQSGNPDLDEERARTLTIGTVLTPRFLPNLIVSADYFRISLDNAIEDVDSQDIVNNCYDDPNGIDNEFCDLLARNRDEGSPTFLGLNFLRQSQLNIGRKVVSGIDFEATYQLDIEETFGAREWGALQFRLFGTRVLKLDDQPNKDDPDFVNPELREIRRPLWVLNGGIQWQRSKLMVNYFLTFLGKQGLDDVEIESATKTFVNPFSDRIYIHDLAASYEFVKALTVYGGVNNITGVDPIATSTSYPVNPLGRVFFLGVSSKL